MAIGNIRVEERAGAALGPFQGAILPRLALLGLLVRVQARYRGHLSHQTRQPPLSLRTLGTDEGLLVDQCPCRSVEHGPYPRYGHAISSEYDVNST